MVFKYADEIKGKCKKKKRAFACSLFPGFFSVFLAHFLDVEEGKQIS